MVLVLDQPQRVADWIGEQMGYASPTVDAAIGYERGGELRAGVYFDAMTESNVCAHIASATEMLPHTLIRAVAIYAFDQAKLKRLTFPIAANNPKAIGFVRAMGAYMEARLSEACGEYDLLLYVLWADDPFPQRLLTGSIDG